jgi:alkanesulfonate monooxygenase SsuD/methylene tetrahydromethanopterin reductase-like flavin-dependent oxidoreductase (luciferase family)
MRIGIVVGYAGAPFADSIALAERAEEAGLAFVALGDANFETLAGMGALAARTSRVELFSAIATWTRTPITAAHAAATLADISGGRYRLGLGAMPRNRSERWHGIPYGQPVERMRDYVAAIRAALAGEESHDGPYYAYSDFPGHRPDLPREVPIYLGTTRPRMTELVGEIADGAMFNTIHSPEWLRDVGWAALDRGLERGGRDRLAVDIGILRACTIDDDPRRAYDLARPALAMYFGIPYFRDLLEYHGFDEELQAGEEAAARGDAAARVAAVSDRMVETMAIAGTPDQVREGVRRYEGLVDWVELAGTIGHPPEIAVEQMHRIIETFAA